MLAQTSLGSAVGGGKDKLKVGKKGMSKTQMRIELEKERHKKKLLGERMILNSGAVG
jgi:hypothetical protein